ncbi:MAG: SGNH/GDSL hydrolase family protein [Pseudomonadales bacterium]|nr:SGNH/GDSL hydrolase family protein [Pseudomonadales bacterium]
MNILSRISIPCVVLMSASLSNLTHAAYTQMISFGDSLSDRGNVFAATGGPVAPYDNGQFSNGDVWTARVASALGVTSEASSLPGGTNYAWGGARTFTGGGGLVPTTQDQVNGYLASTSGVADPNALYTIWTGGNDINGVLGGDTSANFATAATTVGTIAQALVDAGAQSILINNLPNLGLVPGVTAAGPAAVAGATSFTNTFNSILAGAVAGVTGTANITLLDSFSLTNAIVANPASYGLTNATDRCLAADNVTECSNPDDYLFYDDLHPTAAGQQLIADAVLAVPSIAANAIPVPAALPLMLSALMGLGFVKRARKNQAA